MWQTLLKISNYNITKYRCRDNLPLAYKAFLAAAKEGHADSQFNVALMVEQGIGVGKDEKEAVVWYGKSAAQGNAAAQFNLGVLYENGRGTKIDFAKANEWYRKASVQGDALAIGNLGMLYVRGQGVKENKTNDIRGFARVGGGRPGGSERWSTGLMD